MSLPQFKLLRPRTLEDALALLAKHAGESPTATSSGGGTDLIPSMRQKLFEPEYVLDIRHLAGLKDIRQTEHGVEIGALASLTAIEQSALLRRRYPVLTEAAATVASPCSATWARSAATSASTRAASGTTSRLPGAKAAASASRRTAISATSLPAEPSAGRPSPGTRRRRCCVLPPKSRSPARREPGACHCLTSIPARATTYRKLRPDELLTRIFLPESSAGYRGVYRKLRVRGSIDYPLAGVAVVMKRSNGRIADARVAITAVNPAPLVGEGRQRAAGWKNHGRGPGGGGRRPGGEDGSTTYHVGADAGVSAGDDSSVHEEGSPGSGGELVRSAAVPVGCPRSQRRGRDALGTAGKMPRYKT